ncbi:MAG: mechanosensitive ion channel family protein [Proteobacteria bacterium]|nr:mechanosensitive ion channel family protein [Pseudomonadota bacterium]MBU1584462.1 mechanosensitive ion channel family protein [Pseudomonadota bacterium]MBU2452961.1 mechanosensitive ion channel family protein [Pseudomonadota bacterium]MBU2628335.1 mechanosensitive ion channel family protein [Pseudomonadota bacterium]
MESQLAKLRDLADLLTQHGPQLVMGLIIIIGGVLLIKQIMRSLRANLAKLSKNAATVSIVVNTVGVILLSIVITASAIEIGAKPARVVAVLMFLSLIAIGIVVIFRPLMPTLPFKAGNTVKIGELLGKVETVSILNTRLRTFDGKTFFVPNRKILDDIVINYHFTNTRQIKINITIRYDQNLLQAKQVLEVVMIGDPRILAKPSPAVYVLNLNGNGVEIGARCWVDNKKYWAAKCDLTEKIKTAFDFNGIAFAHPQLDIRHYTENNAFKCEDQPAKEKIES